MGGDFRIFQAFAERRSEPFYDRRGGFRRLGDEFFERLPRRIRFHDGSVRAAGRESQRREIFHRETGILIDERDQQDRRRRDENRVTVRHSILGGLNTDGAAAPGFVDDNHLLTKNGGHLRRDNARDDVGHGSRWKRIDDLYGFGRV